MVLKNKLDNRRRKKRLIRAKMRKMQKKKAEKKQEKDSERIKKMINSHITVTNEICVEQPPLRPAVFRPVPLSDLEAGDRCQICLDDFCEREPACRLERCRGHFFHKQCIAKWVDEQRYCPICKAKYGVRTGIMPAGTFRSSLIDRPCAGYDCGTIVINWRIPGGTQTDIHPHPGVRYQGASRTGYLPNTKKGRRVLELLKVAFQRHLMFTVGFSITRSVDNVVIWNEIHAKTSMYGGAANYGYPDDSYLDRVTEELKAKGVTSADLCHTHKPSCSA